MTGTGVCFHDGLTTFRTQPFAFVHAVLFVSAVDSLQHLIWTWMCERFAFAVENRAHMWRVSLSLSLALVSWVFSLPDFKWIYVYKIYSAGKNSKLHTKRFGSLCTLILRFWKELKCFSVFLFKFVSVSLTWVWTGRLVWTRNLHQKTTSWARLQKIFLKHLEVNPAVWT